MRGLPEPTLIDEWQVVPGVLGAVKRAVDVRPDPRRFLVAGSVRGDLEGEVWPGTGRLTRIPLFGMTVREQLGLGSFVFISASGRRPATELGLSPPVRARLVRSRSSQTPPG